MGWFTDLFSTDSKRRNGAALNSTHDAFSLPTSSPVHPDAFNPDSIRTPPPTQYTYPPQSPSPSPYAYARSFTTSRRPTTSSLLPTHMDPMHTPLSQEYPPLNKTWARLRVWLSREYPELGDTLNYPLLPLDLAEIENQLGFALPTAVRDSYLCVDGQEAESAAGCSEGLFFGLTLLPLEDVLEEWRFWREVDADPFTGANMQLRELMQSIPTGWVQKAYSQRGWVPLIADKAGNYVGIDLNPDQGGSPGQVIVFGRDFDTKVVLWRGDGPTGWAKWLASFVDDLESGEGYEIGGHDTSEGSEDDVGYESYFYDGSGRGQGDGGGDSGSGGGLRLTGEYRGWNVLEAWADRSLRKWHEAGLIAEEPIPENDMKGKGIEKGVGLGVMNLTQSPDTETPLITVVGETTPSPAKPKSKLKKARDQDHLPTISISKAPAPRPVALPTAQDIGSLPSPPESTHSSFSDDIESGGHREVEDASLVSGSSSVGESSSSVVRKSSKTRKQTDPGVYSESALPTSPMTPITSSLLGGNTSSSQRGANTPSALRTSSIIPDLMADSAPTLGTVPIEPLALPSPRSDIQPLEPAPAPAVSAHTSHSVSLSESPTTATTTTNDEDDENIAVDTTIRLVGGGGSAGVVSTSEHGLVEDDDVEDSAHDDSDAQSIASVASQSGNAGGKTHVRSRSGLAGLKKLGLGGMRKKEK